MIFNKQKEISESHKERNLYCKIFAGAIFNELLPTNYSVPFIEKLISRYKYTCEVLAYKYDDSI
ncbi:MAG: hypothetical protein QME74_01980, partial [Candidatus Edwardsbacteria bacterium]|nr:hypothetical protein [Candidatus Edwardsbacteria bacterium]